MDDGSGWFYVAEDSKMNTFIIGTTPTIKYTFSEVSVEDITTAVLTVKKGGTIVIEKELTDAVVGESDLSWTLTQSDTLSLGTGIGSIMLNWKLADGTRGASEECNVRLDDNHKAEVI